MALVDTVWYCNFGNGTSTGYYAVTVRPQNTAVAAGVLRRQFTAPAVGSERVFVCIVAGTTANVTDATWVLTRGAKTTDGTATWMECSGQAGLNGDLTNTATWAQVKAATPAVLGQVIKRSNGASYQICTTAGAMSASEPTFSDTAGVTTADTTAVWTSLGVVGNFTGGQAPHARLANASAATWFAAGNTVYVADNHAESQTTAITITPAAAISGLINKFLCHNHSGSYPPAGSDLTTGATVSTTAAANITFSPAGAIYVYGLAFKVGVGASSAAALSISYGISCWSYYDRCSFWVSTTAASQLLFIHTTAGVNNCTFNNCTVKFAAATQYIFVNTGNLIWQNTGQILESGSTVPTALFAMQTSGLTSYVTLEALDLSQITTNVFGTTNANEAGARFIKDCKLNAGVTIQQGGVTAYSSSMVEQVVRSDSGATAYKSSRYAYEGTETTETTIVRDGGATDPAGQTQSRKIVTTANTQWLRPFKAEPYAVWNATTGANVTVTVYGVGTSLPNNDDIWIEAEYVSSTSSPLGSIVTTTKANLLTAGSAVASDSSTWSGGGGSPFKLTTTLSSPQPGMAGYIHVRVRVAKVSATYYIDPQVYLS